MGSRIERFEDLIAWKKARILTSDIYRVTNEGAIIRDFGLRDQIRRAAVSTMSNVAEGFERDTSREFAHFLSIAKGSCSEIRSDLYVALDAGYFKEPVFRGFLAQAEEVSRVLSGLQTSIRKRFDHP